MILAAEYPFLNILWSTLVAAFDQHVREAAGAGGPAGEIDTAQKLLDAGTISQEEFDAIKAKALAG